MKSISQLFFVVFFVILIGCSSDDNSTNPQDTDQHFYPLKVGNTWTYSTSSGNQSIRIDQTATATNGKTAYHIDGDDDYTFGDRNLYYEGSILYGYEGGDPEILFDESTLNLPTERVTVPAGTFDTFKYDWGNQSTRIYWFAKGVGVVKVNFNGSIRELLSYSVN